MIPLFMAAKSGLILRWFGRGGGAKMHYVISENVLLFGKFYSLSLLCSVILYKVPFSNILKEDFHE